MKKEIKSVMLTVRITEQEYDILKDDFRWHLQNPVFCRYLYGQEFNTFSEYLRFTLTKGVNE